MPFKQYNYGSYRKEIKTLMHKRIIKKARIREANHKIIKYEQDLKKIEGEIEGFLSLVKGRAD